VIQPSLRELIRPADRENVPDLNRRIDWIIFRKVQIASHIREPGFVQEAGADRTRIAQRMILAKYRLRSRPFRTELSISGKVRLIAFVKVIPVGQTVFVAQFVI